MKNQINETKVQGAMRSLYRLTELQNMGSPDVLINNEKKILTRHLTGLSGAEILIVTSTFTEYYDQQRVQTALDDEKMAEDFSRWLNRVN